MVPGVSPGLSDSHPPVGGRPAGTPCKCPHRPRVRIHFYKVVRFVAARARGEDEWAAGRGGGPVEGVTGAETRQRHVVSALPAPGDSIVPN